MILIEDTHWPLVVVGVHDGAFADALAQRVARLRWHLPQPRLVTIVVPGVGADAVQAHNLLVRWLKRHVSTATPLNGAAWVIPDAAVRAIVTTLIDVSGGRAFGAPSKVFRTVADALCWLRAVSQRDQNLPEQT